MATKEPTPFTPGTLVWAKFYDIFWPGKVVDPSSAPQKTQDIMNQKRNPLAMVFFVEDNKYDIVMSINKVFLYSCPKKMEYVKKGYSLYLRELNGIKTKNVEMKNFLKDVLRFEEEIGGNINIFKEFEKERDEEKTPKRQQLIKKLFSSSSGHKKEKSKKKKIKQQLNISILSPTTSNTTQRNMTEEPNIQDELLKDEDNKKDKNDEDNEKDKNDDDHMNEDNKKDKNDVHMNEDNEKDKNDVHMNEDNEKDKNDDDHMNEDNEKDKNDDDHLNEDNEKNENDDDHMNEDNEKDKNDDDHLNEDNEKNENDDDHMNLDNEKDESDDDYMNLDNEKDESDDDYMNLDNEKDESDDDYMKIYEEPESSTEFNRYFKIRSVEEMQARRQFINDILSNKKITHFYLDD